jgi:hypothetical protein
VKLGLPGLRHVYLGCSLCIVSFFAGGKDQINLIFDYCYSITKESSSISRNYSLLFLDDLDVTYTANSRLKRTKTGQIWQHWHQTAKPPNSTQSRKKHYENTEPHCKPHTAAATNPVKPNQTGSAGATRDHTHKPTQPIKPLLLNQFSTSFYSLKQALNGVLAR